MMVLASTGYLTDGIDLYEIVGRQRNYGRTGGCLLTVRDCRTETVREMRQPEQAWCRTVTPRRGAER